jgi:hypothetical protein
MKKIIVGLVAVASAALLGATAVAATSGPAGGGGSGNDCAGYDPQVPAPGNFVATIDNRYFPLPVGRTLVYRGVKDGASLIDTVTVTDHTRSIMSITATQVSDVSTHHGSLLEKTKDWYAQDGQGNVWYLGEDTEAFLPNGKVDTSGSWLAGVNGAQPGIIMEGDPTVPDAYRQECRSGQAEDMAWVVSTGGSTTVPFGTVHRTLRTLEFSALEPAGVDQKIYGPGLGIVFEQTMAGGHEVSKLVRVSG